MPAMPGSRARATRSRGAVYTLDADRYDGPIVSLADGQLAIDCDPPMTVPLDEVDHIDLGAASAVLLVWVGQDNHDGAQAGATAGGSGIQDIHLRMPRRGPRPQNHAGSRFRRHWRGGAGLDARSGQHAVLAAGKRPAGRQPHGRPLSGAARGRLFRAAARRHLVLDDKTMLKNRLIPSTHTDGKLKFDKDREGEKKTPEPLVFLAGDETIRGRSVEIADETLRLRLTTGAELKISLAEVRGVWFGGDQQAAQRKKFDERLKQPGGADWALIQSKEKAPKEQKADKQPAEAAKPGQVQADNPAEEKKTEEKEPAPQESNDKQSEAKADADKTADEKKDDEKKDDEKKDDEPAAEKKPDEKEKPAKADEKEKEPVAVEGSIAGIAEGRLALAVGEQTRKVGLDRVLGLVMAQHPAPEPPRTFYQVFELTGGEKLWGRLTAVKPDVLEIHSRFGADVKLPRGEVLAITCRNGRATYLSDLEPASIEEVAYFERPTGYHRDQGLSGGPLIVRGTTFRKGLAVHSRCVLTYRLDGGYELFRARLGFEEVRHWGARSLAGCWPTIASCTRIPPCGSTPSRCP